MARRKRNRIVLDIGNSAIRLCELTPAKSGFQLTRYHQRDVVLDPSIGEDERRAAFQQAIAGLLKEAKVRGKRVVTAVPGQSVFTRPRPLPPVPEHKVAQIVRYEIQQQIPFSLDQIALDYQVLSKDPEAGGYFVLMAAIKVDIVENFLQILPKGLKAETVQVGPIATYNWLRTAGQMGGQGESVALIDIGAATTDILIETDGQYRWNRPLSVGGNDITQAIASEGNMSFQDAEAFKRQRAFAPTGDAERDGKAGEVVGRALQRLVSEITRSLSYYRSQPGGSQVQRAVVCGGGACLKNMIPYLQRELGMEVRIAQPLAGVAVGAGAQEANNRPEASGLVLGMALATTQRPPIELNLLPPRAKEALKRKEQSVYWAIIVALVVVMMVAGIPAAAKRNERVLENIERQREAISAYDPALARKVNVDNPAQSGPLTSQYESELSELESQVSSQQELVEALDAALEDRISWFTYVSAINEARTAVQQNDADYQIWIASIEATEIGGSGGRGGGRGGRGGGGGGGMMGMMGGGMGAVGGGEAEWPSSGFPGISSQSQREGGMGMMGGMGPMGGGRGGGASEEFSEPTSDPPQAFNGLIIRGYANAPEGRGDEAVTAFYDRLVESGAFIEDGVYLDNTSLQRVDASELYNSPLAGGSGGATGGGMDRGAGGFGGGMAGTGSAARGFTTAGTIIRFRIDVQFEGQAWEEGASAQGPGMGGDMMDPFGMPGMGPGMGPGGER
jgi:type IV pilus assembly protein PilM